VNRTPPPQQWRSAIPAGAVFPAAHSLTTPQLSPLLVLALVAGAVIYNAVLAWLTARGVWIGSRHVIAAEFLVLAATSLTLLVWGRRSDDGIPLLFASFFIVGSLLISMGSQALYPEMARNAVIAALFLMLGMRAGPAALRLCFAIAAAVVAAGLMLEIADARAYVDLFEPARYYQLTRGSEPLEWVDGLYRNASGFEGRFAIANIIDHRASSIFLEPVSLGNFGVVLIGFVTCFWERLKRIEKVAYVALAILILLTTNSRILLGFMALCPLIYFVAPRASRNRRLVILPAVLAVAVLVYFTGPEIYADNLTGRIGKAVHNLTELGVPGLFGASPELASGFSDSGFAFVIAASSAFGLMVLWLFISLVVPEQNVLQRRAGLFLCFYVALSLLISGTSVFSIKVAALLWLLMGVAAALAPDGEAGAETAPAGTQNGGWRVEPRARSARGPSATWADQGIAR